MIIILIIIAAIIAIPFIAAAFTSSTYIIEREAEIGQPVQVVFEYLRHLQNQSHYNKWVMADTKTRRVYSGTDGTTGATVSWDSANKNVGKGVQQIIELSDGKRIDYRLEFEKPFKNIAYTYLVTETIGAGRTRVKWGFTGERDYALRLVHILFNLKKVLGNDIQTSLGNLKAILEKQWSKPADVVYTHHR